MPQKTSRIYSDVYNGTLIDDMVAKTAGSVGNETPAIPSKDGVNARNSARRRRLDKVLEPWEDYGAPGTFASAYGYPH